MRPRRSGENRPNPRRPHVVALCGSRRDESYTRLALEEALKGARATGATTKLVDLGALDLPPMDPDDRGAGDAQELRHALREADAIVLGTPMYHGSHSGVLKNALDYCGFEEFEGTTVGLLVVSGGPFPTPALDHLRVVCRSLRAWVLPYQAAVPEASIAFTESGLHDSDHRDRVRTLGERAAEYAEIRPAPDRGIQCGEA